MSRNSSKKLTKTLTPWVYKEAPVGPVPKLYYGFVYEITNITNGRKYIGRKYLWSKRRTKIKGKRRRVIITSESDWRYYKSSSKELQEDIALLGVNAFKFEILSFYNTRSEVNYNEVREQFVRDVLFAKLNPTQFLYYNYCILNRYYRKSMVK